MSIQVSKKPTTSHILGIDYGKSKIGLAMADSETRIAFGYGALENDKNFLQKLTGIIEQENISKVIIGAQSCRGFTSTNIDVLSRQKLENFLRKNLKVEVEYQDEMFTTLEAQRNLKEKGAKGIKRFDDQEAARLILQGWLDNSRNM
jgi:putative holliday junction resolvase